ncbi:urease accessory protein UreF [Frigidibacter sp. MR17.24]|uniref:urease accessory protein UreF n=1 Tax=Frigidibacter sp. MR17.24 TaxID=3127345 RepID=UPI003012EBAB
MTDALRLARMLQFADSAFPGGGFAFSWGLETALAEGTADRRDLRAWIAQDLRGRWHPFDRLVLAGGHRLAGAALADWAATVDAHVALERQRQASLQSGEALIAAARAIGLPCDPVIEALRDRGHGHFALVHGHLLRGAGLDLAAALVVSASGAARQALSVAVRLNALGAIGTQRELLALQPLIAALAGDLPDGTEPLSSFAPLAEIALMRPRPDRLFVN